MIQKLLFDIGNVLVFFDFGRTARRVACRSSLSETTIVASLSNLVDSMERGELDGEQFLQRAVEETHFEGGPEEFRTAFVEIFTLNEPMVALIGKLSQSHPLYLFSNTGPIHVDYLFRRYPVFQLFNEAVYSFVAKSMKPEPEIYRKAIEQCTLVPEETLYIDDRAENIAEGVAQGFQTFCYDGENHTDFEGALTNVFGLSPTGSSQPG